MIMRASCASSRIVDRCSGWYSPVAFLKTDFLRPRRRACSVMASANLHSLPPSLSAMAIEASLPDCTMMPLSISSTLAVLPSGTNIADVRDGAPPVRQAYSLIITSVSGVISPARSAL